jgi:Tfp pilus assembly protein PilO
MAAVKLSDREKRLALTTLGLLIFYVFYVFVLSPKWDEVNRLREKVRQQHLDLKVAESKMRILEIMQKNMGLSAIKTGISKEERALEVLRAISRATSESKLNLVSIKPALEEGDGLKFDLYFKGTYQQVYDFLRILKFLKVVVVIDNLNVTGGVVKTPSLEIKLAMTAYY